MIGTTINFGLPIFLFLTHFPHMVYQIETFKRAFETELVNYVLISSALCILSQFPCFILWMMSIRRMCLNNHPGFDNVCSRYLCSQLSCLPCTSPIFPEESIRCLKVTMLVAIVIVDTVTILYVYILCCIV